MQYTLLVDMDEVLCDFVGGACQLFGTTKEELHKIQVPGIWDIVAPLSLCRGCLHPKMITTHRFWGSITEQGEDFWVNLEPLPWANTLVTFIGDLIYSGLLAHENWHVITAPSKCPTSYSGKVKWLKNFFGKEFDRFCITPHKEIFAKSSAILIDDREENIVKFEKSGGIGVLFPSRGNRLYEFHDNPIPYVITKLSQILH